MTDGIRPGYREAGVVCNAPRYYSLKFLAPWHRVDHTTAFPGFCGHVVMFYFLRTQYTFFFLFYKKLNNVSCEV